LNLKKIRRDGLDLNKISSAKEHFQFIPTIKSVIEKDEKTLVVWVHGIKDENIEVEKLDTQKANSKTHLKTFTQ